MTDDEMVDHFANACLKAGRSNSGLVFSAGFDLDWENMQAWRDLLKTRIDELKRQIPNHTTPDEA